MTSLNKAIAERKMTYPPTILNVDELVSSSSYAQSYDFSFDGTFANSFSTNSLNNLIAEQTVERDVQKNNGIQSPSFEKEKGIRKMYLAAFASMMNAVAVGVSSTYIGPATYDMQKHRNSGISVNDEDVSWITSVAALGTVPGALIAGRLADKIGRKGSLIFNSLTLLISWLMIMYANGVSFLIAGRFVSGIAVGIVYTCLPMYAVEISTPDSRGFLGASFQASVAVGTLIVMTLGAFLPWTWLAVAGSIVGVIALLLFCPMPESPRWLLTQKRRKEALGAIRFLQGESFDAEAECKAIEEDLRQHQTGSLTLKELMHPTIYKPTLISLSLMFTIQACGSTVIISYTSEIFDAAGSSLKPEYSTIIVGFIQVVGTVLSAVTMDKAGRRILLLVSGSLMGLSLAVLGAFHFVSANDVSFKRQTGWLPLTCLVVYIAAFNLGYGPIPFLMVSEMLPMRARSLVSGISIFVLGLLAFIVIKSFKMTELALHSYGAFWLYASFSFLSCVFVWFLVPETKGKPLEEIQYFFLKRPQSIDQKTVS